MTYKVTRSTSDHLDLKGKSVKSVLIDRLTEENKAAEKAGEPFLRSGKEIISEIVNEISDETAEHILKRLLSGSELYKILDKLTEGADIEEQEPGRIRAILWEIYITEREGTGIKTCPAIEKALLNIFYQSQPFFPAAQHIVTTALLELTETGFVEKDGIVYASISNGAGEVYFILNNPKKYIANKRRKNTDDEDIYWTVTRKRLLWELVVRYRATGNISVVFSLSDYEESRNWKGTEKALRAEIRDALMFLTDLRVEYYDKISGKREQKGGIPLGGWIESKNNKMYIWGWFHALEEELARHTIDYSGGTRTAELKTGAFEISLAIDTNYRRNEGKDRQNKISILTLYKAAGKKLPDIDKCISQRHPERPINSFFKVLNSLPNLYYSVYTADSVYVSEPLKMNIVDFINGYISVNYSDYPKHPSRVEKRDQFIEAKRKAKNTKKCGM